MGIGIKKNRYTYTLFRYIKTLSLFNFLGALFPPTISRGLSVISFKNPTHRKSVKSECVVKGAPRRKKKS